MFNIKKIQTMMVYNLREASSKYEKKIILKIKYQDGRNRRTEKVFFLLDTHIGIIKSL